MSEGVFHDPTGRRGRRLAVVSGLLAAIVLLIAAGFFATLATAPRMPTLALKDPRVLRALHVETAHALRGHKAWTRIPHPPRAAVAAATVKPLAVGFYVSWDETSRSSLRAHVDALDVVSPQWIAIGNGGALDVTRDPQARAILASAKRPPALMPGVFNAEDGVWNGPAADHVVLDAKARAALIARLVELSRAQGYAGYVFDLEDLSPAAVAAYPRFIAEARAALKPLGRDVWVTTPFADPDWPLRRLQAAADAVVLMAYDQHWGTGDPGPAAGQDWFQSHLAATLATLDPARTIIAMGAYGYDWTLPKPGSDSRAARRGSATAVTFDEATQIAHDSGATAAMDPASLNPTFAYADERGASHEVWFLDAATLFNQLRVADGFHPLGYALWRMGGEDPLVWSLLQRAPGSSDPLRLANLAPGQNVDFDGSGEVLKVTDIPRPGHRALGVDAATGLISSETYDVTPTSYVIQRYGARPGLVALTFDDGPDRRWTPKILDILRAKHAPATFFVIGKNMSEAPDLVAREVREGHDVGNHTWTHPNIGEVPVAETAVELSATQRLFETVTGRSMRLFRPPFFGDAEPSTPQEVAPLLDAQQQGYITVGLRIDPDDWKKPDPQRIVATALDRLDDTVRPGQIVLLHDSGGDRSRTVEALPALIDALRAHGYRLVTVGELAGMTPQEAMPASARDPVGLALDRVGFGFLHTVDDLLRALFVTAIVLGVARLAFLAALSLIHAARARPPLPGADASDALITVLIPCFNEAKVIASSVRRILASDWDRIEILVLDDGSTDGTSQVVREAFPNDPRVTLLTFENGGKARALNRGLEHARGDIVVALDADTLFPKETLRQLARWFVDPKVGAVAGNAVVGNRVNLLTRWQALEYVIAQNLERRALAALGAVTVVPGAVGAWRREALMSLGGYPADTLAEDQDLTLAVQRAGWTVQFDPEARAYTEAPETVSALLKQRFRWSFGTLQCVWKHRAGLFDVRRPVLGFVALPQIWLFQIALAVLAPLVDLAVVWSLVQAVYSFAFHPAEWSPDDLWRALSYWAAFVLLDLSAGAIGMALERRAPWRDLVWMPIQRFGYRQLMYYVVLKSIGSAMAGARVGWEKLDRSARVALDHAA